MTGHTSPLTRSGPFIRTQKAILLILLNLPSPSPLVNDHPGATFACTSNLARCRAQTLVTEREWARVDTAGGGS